jgi:hypothetical protein
MKSFTSYEITNKIWIETTTYDRFFELIVYKTDDNCNEERDFTTVFSIYILNPFYKIKNE